jgi:hypothetical protein
MDDAIETLQTCLRLLDLVHRVGEMIREGKYWGALRVGRPPGFMLIASLLKIYIIYLPPQYREPPSTPISYHLYHPSDFPSRAQ